MTFKKATCSTMSCSCLSLKTIPYGCISREINKTNVQFLYQDSTWDQAQKHISGAKKTDVDIPCFPRAIVLQSALCPAGYFSFTSYYTSLLPQQWTGTGGVSGWPFYST